MANKDSKHQLDRRIFILGSAAAGALAAQTQLAAPKPDGHRRSYDLNRKWLFGGKTRAGVSSPGFNDSDWRKITSVSYTHLRAHETDSYLVCRLLLEKK